MAAHAAESGNTLDIARVWEAIGSKASTEYVGSKASTMLVLSGVGALSGLGYWVVSHEAAATNLVVTGASTATNEKVTELQQRLDQKVTELQQRLDQTSRDLLVRMDKQNTKADIILGVVVAVAAGGLLSTFRKP
jgi:uncharacterized membrane protein YhiD involved in acid resistance